jgi:iron complex outermembrane receptor protein
VQNKKSSRPFNTKVKPIASAVAIAMFAMMDAAWAQSSPTGQLEEVLVTANKRIEKVEHVPMAISVLTDAQIQRANIREMEEVIALTPSLTINSGTTAANNAIFMRGIGTVSVGIGVESDVSVIIDDIPIATQFQAFKDLADVARIEVLKGPQSTLFGKSAVAGAVNIVTKPISGPLMTRFSTYRTSDHEWRIGGSVSGNVNNEFGLRVAFSNTNMPGNFYNLTTSEYVNGSAGQSLIAKLSWHPTPNLDIDLLPRYNDQKNSRGVTAINGFYTSTGSAAAGNLVLTPITAAGTYLNGTAALPASVNLAGIDVNDPNNRNVRRDFPTGLNSQDKGTGLKFTYALPNDMTLMSITSFSHYTANDYRDQDFVDVPTIALPGSTALVAGNNQFGTYDIKSSTQEFRLLSPDTGTFRYIAGLWWAKNKIERHFIRGVCVAPAVCASTSVSSPTNYFTDIENVNKSLFGQATWDFAKDWTMVGGLRMNSEESGFHYARNYYTNQLDASTFVPGPVGVDQFQSTGNVDRALTGKFSIQRQMSKEWMIYAMAATGYKGIAYDVTSGLKAAAAFPVEPEISQTMEIGTKANLFNNRLALAATLYSSDFFHYQQNVTYVLPNDPTIYSQLNSIPRLRTHGAELDANFLITNNFSGNFSLAYTLPTIELWKNGPCYADSTNVAVGTTKLAANGSIAGQNAACFPITAGSTTGVQDMSGGIFTGTPKVKAVLGGNYEIPMASMPFNAPFGGFVNFTTRYQSDYNTNINNDPRAVNKAYSITDLGFGIRAPNDGYTVSFRVNNLFDRFYIPNANASGPSYRTGPTSTSPSVTVNSWVPPRDVFRYFSVKLDVKF